MLFGFIFAVLSPWAREKKARLSSDEELERNLRLAQDGDDEAFSYLVDRYERFVFDVALRTVTLSGASPSMAEDIAQEAFIKAWRALPSFRGDSVFTTWLYRITVNAARDHLSREGRHRAESLTREDEDGQWDVPVTSGEDIPEEAVEKKERITAVRRAIESLPEDQRQVVVMRDIHELSYNDIAEALGLEMGTVKSRINRGRAALKKILESGNFI